MRLLKIKENIDNFIMQDKVEHTKFLEFMLNNNMDLYYSRFPVVEIPIYDTVNNKASVIASVARTYKIHNFNELKELIKGKPINIIYRFMKNKYVEELDFKHTDSYFLRCYVIPEDYKFINIIIKLKRKGKDTIL